MYNLDSYGSHLGVITAVHQRPPGLRGVAADRTFAPLTFFYQTITAVVPYADHFPFVAAGMPGVFHYRVNCDGGRFFRRRPDEQCSTRV